MGIEQGTPVTGSTIDLLRNIDLPDLRLPRAFQAWTEFKTRHEPQVAAIGTLPLDQVVALGNELSVLIGQAIGMEAIDQSKHIDEKKIRLLADSISSDGNRIIFMRHGEQSPPEWVFSISHPGVRKIRMMQNPFNKEDLLTNRGLINVFLTAFGLLYVKEATGKEVHIVSSENSRAKEVAEVISIIIPGSTFSIDDGLSCIIYKDEKDEPPVSIEEVLEDIPSGFMPWEPKLVDRLCKRTSSGLRQSELIISTVRHLVEKVTSKEGEGNLLVVLTHTQQLAEVLRQRGRLEDPKIRFPELTMLLLEGNSLQILERGILT